MAIEYMSFEDVLGELQIDEEELKKLVSQGELRGFRAGLSMKFKKDDVLNLKQGRETEPTIILTDSDQEMGIAESSDELILEDSASDTVINIGDIMGGKKAGASQQQEIIFDTTEEYTVSPHPESGSAAASASESASASASASGSDPEAQIPTVEVPSVSEDMGIVETDSDAALVEVGSDESMETEAFELMDESAGDASGTVDVAPVKGKSQRRAVGVGGASARMRALEIAEQRSHAGMTLLLLVGMILLSVQAGVVSNDMRGVDPQWTTTFTGYFRGVVDTVYTWFNS
jgi:hypothetical protein